jgi:hypothetical protein
MSLDLNFLKNHRERIVQEKFGWYEQYCIALHLIVNEEDIILEG